MLGVKKKTEFSLEEFYIKIEFSSQRREMLLFLTTNMVAVTSPAIAHWGATFGWSHKQIMAMSSVCQIPNCQ